MLENSVDPTSEPQPPVEATGLPWLRSWRSVYIFVVMIFVLWVSLLALLERAFS